jgi:hypothetical protein
MGGETSSQFVATRISQSRGQKTGFMETDGLKTSVGTGQFRFVTVHWIACRVSVSHTAMRKPRTHGLPPGSPGNAASPL